MPSSAISARRSRSRRVTPWLPASVSKRPESIKAARNTPYRTTVNGLRTLRSSPCSASWPQAAAMSSPLRLRTKTSMPCRDEHALERVDRRAGSGAASARAVDRVHRDQVHLHAQPAQQPRELARVVEAVVLAGDQRVLDGDAAALAAADSGAARPAARRSGYFLLIGIEPRCASRRRPGVQRDREPDLAAEVAARADRSPARARWSTA